MKKVFIATIKVAIQAESQTEACDALTAMLTEHLMHDPETSLVDWQYTQAENGQVNEPELKGEYDLSIIEEGEIFNS